jgi:hypothetical protein
MLAWGKCPATSQTQGDTHLFEFVAKVLYESDFEEGLPEKAKHTKYVVLATPIGVH